MNTSARIARSLEKATGKMGKRITVKMRGTKELSRFMRMFRKAQKDGTKSRLRYGDSLRNPTEHED